MNNCTSGREVISSESSKLPADDPGRLSERHCILIRAIVVKSTQQLFVLRIAVPSDTEQSSLTLWPKAGDTGRHEPCGERRASPPSEEVRFPSELPVLCGSVWGFTSVCEGFWQEQEKSWQRIKREGRESCAHPRHFPKALAPTGRERSFH